MADLLPSDQPTHEAMDIIRSVDQIQPCYLDLASFVLDHKEYDLDKPILIDATDQTRFVSLKYARMYVGNMMGELAASGVRPGDTVCIHMHNDILYPLVFLGIVAFGAIASPVNPSYTKAELKHQFTVSKAVAYITEDGTASLIEEVVAELSSASPQFSPNVRRIAPDCLQYPLFLLGGKNGSDYPGIWRRRFNNSYDAKHAIALLASTSGTTGMPKMAARSHFSLVNENLAIEQVKEEDKAYGVRRLLCTPFFHGFTMPLAVISALRLGYPTFVMKRFDTIKLLQHVRSYSITETAMPPPVLIRYLNMDALSTAALHSVHLVWSGGAPMAATTQERAVKMFHAKGRICQVWGMTEGGWMTTFHYPETNNTGSVGRLLATYEAKFVVPTADEVESSPADQDRVCRVGDMGPDGAPQQVLRNRESGEVWIRGPINMLRYFNNKEDTDAMFVDGWMRTGDLGYVNDDGCFFINDRLKDLIKVRGWQVPPAELEGRLLEHPLVADAGAVGARIPPDNCEEIPYVFVVAKNESLTEASIKVFLLERLARYKVMDIKVVFWLSLPKSPSGKILRKDLKTWAEKKLREEYELAQADWQVVDEAIPTALTQSVAKLVVTGDPSGISTLRFTTASEPAVHVDTIAARADIDTLQADLEDIDRDEDAADNEKWQYPVFYRGG